jgi:hypothetical protein
MVLLFDAVLGGCIYVLSCNIPSLFFQMFSGSILIQSSLDRFVGVGARRVRALFQAAKKKVKFCWMTTIIRKFRQISLFTDWIYPYAGTLYNIY